MSGSQSTRPDAVLLTIRRQALNASIELRVSLETNAITLVPQRPHMSPNSATVLEAAAPDNHVLGDQEVSTPGSEGTTTSASSAKKAGGKCHAKDKAPRPKNAFIIYRKEYHPKVVANFPDLHNNDICKYLTPHPVGFGHSTLTMP